MKLHDTLDDLCGDAIELDLLVSQMKDLMVECKYIIFPHNKIHKYCLFIIIYF